MQIVHKVCPTATPVQDIVRRHYSSFSTSTGFVIAALIEW
jgi:hypothetical protein